MKQSQSLEKNDDSARYKTSLAGQMLLALPTIGDPRFVRTALIMTIHDSEGAMGIALTAATENMTVGDVLDHLGIIHEKPFEQPILIGGPVEPRRGFVLHSSDWRIRESLEITPSWMLTSSHEILWDIAKDKGPKNWRVILGYAGWTGGQLEQELMTHSWHIVEADDALLFATPSEDCWRAAYKKVGVEAHWISAKGGNA